MSNLFRAFRLLRLLLTARSAWRRRALAAEARLRLAQAELAMARGVSEVVAAQVCALGVSAERSRRALSGERR